MEPHDLSRSEVNQLNFIARGLQMNEALPHDRRAVAALIDKGLLKSVGIAVKLTPEGEAMLGRL